MSLLRFSKNAGARISHSFVSSEFDCKCEDPACTTQIDEDLIKRLETLREKVGAPLRVNSGYRCKQYQDELRARGYETSNGPSQHELGRASDVSRTDERQTGIALELLAREAGFTSVGVGHSFIHVDLRPGYKRWEYTKR